MNGVVKRKVEDRGFGFIKIEGKKGDLFFHLKELGNIQWEDLKEGDKVTFEIEDGAKGPKAVKITVP